MFMYITDIARNYSIGLTNKWTYCDAVKQLGSAVKAYGGKPVINALRGPSGAENGSRETAVVVR